MRILLCFILFIFHTTFTSFAQDSIYRIAFGSCSHQDKAIPVFHTILQHQPDLFIFLGDNIYGDTDNMCKMRRKYRKMAKNEDYKVLQNSLPIIATWDDHDYGENDAGRHYKKKQKSKKLFLKFFNESKESERYKRDGIYTSYYYTVNGKNLQIILLDNRTFRDNLLLYNGSLASDTNYTYYLDYSPHTNSDSTILGEKQWLWLENELKKPADVRIIGSSTQFSTQYNGYESWANFPSEQLRMQKLIQSTNANGIVFISGDVHYAELSKMESDFTYPLYDLTASGLTEQWRFATPNINRIGNAVMENHFGMININWNEPEIQISMEIWDVNNNLRLLHVIPLEELKYAVEKR